MSNRENWSQNAALGGAEQTDGQNSGPRVLMVLLVVLALIASILMLFLDSDLWLKIAVIAALWAAFLGIVLVSKYSSALRAEQKRVNTLERAHRAEMEREVASYQQREAALKENYTRQLRNQRDEHLEQLRHELISLRAQLAEMSGEELDDEQTAVRARAERIIELDRAGVQPTDRRYQSGKSGQAEQAKKHAARSSQPGASARAASSAGAPALGHHSEPSSDRRASAFSTGSFAAVKWTGDNTEETTQIPIVVDSSSSNSAQSGAQSSASGAQAAANRGSEAAEPKAAGRGQHEQREAAQAPQQERAAHPAPRTEPAFRAYEPSKAAGEQASESAQKQAAPQDEQQREQAAKPAAKEKRGAHEYRAGRRRADENSEGLTVAELMKRFQQNDKK